MSTDLIKTKQAQLLQLRGETEMNKENKARKRALTEMVRYLIHKGAYWSEIKYFVREHNYTLHRKTGGLLK